MRNGSLVLIEYIIDHSLLTQSKNVLEYFAGKGSITASEIETDLQPFRDPNWKFFSNTLKYEFQLEKNGLDVITRGSNPITQNHYNLRRNATVNTLVDLSRTTLKKIADNDCLQTLITTAPAICNSETACLFQLNGIGQYYISAVTPSPLSFICNETTYQF